MFSAAARIGPSDRRALMGIVALCLVLFADVLLLPGDAVPSDYSGDIALYHSRVRDFGFDELRQGNLALWNPHIYSGTPLHGSMQASLTYPLNAIYLVLPLAKALSLDLFLQVAIYGCLTYVWARSRTIRPLGAFFAASMVMFAGTCSLRVLAGQMNIIGTFAWAPLLLMAIDKIFRAANEHRNALNWCLVGILATTMAALVSHPQVLYVVAATVALYTALGLVGNPGRLRALPQLALIAVIPFFTSAIQLWPGLSIGSESTREGGATYEFVSTSSFPIENLLTMLVPVFLGDRINTDYWGRWAFWDTSFFLGITGLLLALYGAVYARSTARRFCLIMCVWSTLIALGPHTPVHRFLFEWAPGFNLFRGVSTFLLPATLFAALLAGCGVDELFRRTGRAYVFIAAVGAVAVSGAAMALWVRSTAALPFEANGWYDFLATMKATPGVFLWEEIRADYVRETANLAIVNLSIATGTGAILALLLWFTPKRQWAKYAIVAIGVAELFIFARTYRGTFELSQNDRPQMQANLEAHPGNHRIYDTGGWENTVLNYTIQSRQQGVWGYDPVLLRRYAEFMSYAVGGQAFYDRLRHHVFTFGTDPLGQAVRFGTVQFTEDEVLLDPKLLQMFRCRFVVHPPEDDRYASLIGKIRLVQVESDTQPLEPWQQEERIYEFPDPSPHYYLVRGYQVLQEKNAIFAALSDSRFEPSRRVILEEEPSVSINSLGVGGEVTLVEQSTDHMTFEASLDDSALLIITDSYSQGWRVRGLGDSAHKPYQLLPANYAMRAIPLEAGEHEFVVEYSPAAFRYGRLSSAISGSLLLFVSIYRLRRANQRREDVT